MTESEKITFRNGVTVYPFSSFDELIEFVQDKKEILVAINAEKILHATELTKGIINRHIAYCDGMGAVKVAQKHGVRNAVKLSGCELWLRIIES